MEGFSVLQPLCSSSLGLLPASSECLGTGINSAQTQLLGTQDVEKKEVAVRADLLEIREEERKEEREGERKGKGEREGERQGKGKGKVRGKARQGKGKGNRHSQRKANAGGWFSFQGVGIAVARDMEGRTSVPNSRNTEVSPLFYIHHSCHLLSQSSPATGFIFNHAGGQQRVGMEPPGFFGG